MRTATLSILLIVGTVALSDAHALFGSLSIGGGAGAEAGVQAGAYGGADGCGGSGVGVQKGLGVGFGVGKEIGIGARKSVGAGVGVQKGIGAGLGVQKGIGADLGACASGGAGVEAVAEARQPQSVVYVVPSTECVHGVSPCNYCSKQAVQPACSGSAQCGCPTCIKIVSTHRPTPPPKEICIAVQPAQEQCGISY